MKINVPGRESSDPPEASRSHRVPRLAKSTSSRILLRVFGWRLRLSWNRLGSGIFPSGLSRVRVPEPLAMKSLF
jgi:hypothetical protein